MVVIKIIYSNEEYEEGNDVILQYDTNNDFDVEIVTQTQKHIEHMYPKSNIISIPQYIDINFVKRKRKELEEIYKGE